MPTRQTTNLTLKSNPVSRPETVSQGGCSQSLRNLASPFFIQLFKCFSISSFRVPCSDVLTSRVKTKVFTLIELLIVVAMIAILTAMLLPALNTVREKARMIQCASNVKQITFATLGYTNKFDDYLPWINKDKGVVWNSLVIAEIFPASNIDTAPGKVLQIGKKYKKIFQCPSMKLDSPMHYSYCYNQYMAASYIVAEGYNPPCIKISRIKRPSLIIMTGDGSKSLAPDNWSSLYFGAAWSIAGDLHNGGAEIGYTDGHVEYKRRYQVTRAGALPEDNSSVSPWTEYLERIWGKGQYMYQ